MRTGSEPVTARSALRTRFWLSVWGLVWAIFGTVAFALVGRPGWAAACGALLLVVAIDMAVILRHIRQGPHYQPGPDIPPYRPLDDHGAPPYRPSPKRKRMRTRKRERERERDVPPSPRPPEDRP